MAREGLTRRERSRRERAPGAGCVRQPPVVRLKKRSIAVMPRLASIARTATLPTLFACRIDADLNDIFVGDTGQWATRPRAIFRRAGQRSIGEARAARAGGGFLKSGTSVRTARVARFGLMLIAFFASHAADFSSSDG